MLSSAEIRAEMAKGSIVISPFNARQLKPNSYDVRVGANFYGEALNSDCKDAEIYNIYDRTSTFNVWKPRIPSVETEGVLAGKQVLWLKPGERVLGHTVEFIGGLSNVTTMIKTRSSVGRSGISTCLCAGSGDIGYFNRWTLEISNHLHGHTVPIVVGEPIAQMLFFRTAPGSAEYAGKYQTGKTLAELERDWKPEDMLPQLYVDAERWSELDASAPASSSAGAEHDAESAPAPSSAVTTGSAASVESASTN